MVVPSISINLVSLWIRMACRMDRICGFTGGFYSGQTNRSETIDGLSTKLAS